MSLQQILPILRFSSGRRILTYDRLRPIAERHGNAALLAHIDRARAHERETRSLENYWSSPNRRSPYPAQVSAVDNAVDNVLTAIRDIARAHLQGWPDGADIVEDIERFLAEIFPNGVAAITALPYVDQVAAVEALIAKMQNGLGDVVRALGLDSKLKQLIELTAEYRRLVNLGRTDVDFALVREFRARGQLYLREIIGLVIGSYFDSDNPEHLAARDELLSPILQQMTELHSRARARRSGRAGGIEETDETGEIDEGDEIDEDGESEPIAAPEPIADRGAAAIAAAASDRPADRDQPVS